MPNCVSEEPPVNIFSTAHFAAGLIAKSLGIEYQNWFLMHVAFEIWEQTEYGIRFYNQQFWKDAQEIARQKTGLFTRWCPYEGDSIQNMLVDHFFALLPYWL